MVFCIPPIMPVINARFTNVNLFSPPALLLQDSMLSWLDLFAQSLQRFPLQAKFHSQPRRRLENSFPEPILHGGSFAAKMHAPDTATGQQLVRHIQQREGMRHAAIHHQAAPRLFSPVGALLPARDMTVVVILVDSARDLCHVHNRNSLPTRVFDEPLVKPSSANRKGRHLLIGIWRKN